MEGTECERVTIAGLHSSLSSRNYERPLVNSQQGNGPSVPQLPTTSLEVDSNPQSLQMRAQPDCHLDFGLVRS